jgi:hypothetical protein
MDWRKAVPVALSFVRLVAGNSWRKTDAPGDVATLPGCMALPHPEQGPLRVGPSNFLSGVPALADHSSQHLSFFENTAASHSVPSGVSGAGRFAPLSLRSAGPFGTSSTLCS